MPSRLLRPRWVVAMLAWAVAVTGSLAYAAIPDAGGVIHSCYTKSSGAWRVIDSDTGQTCKSNEAALDLYGKGAADLTFLAKTGKAADADKLDGQDSSSFLGASAKAADSDKLDGRDSIDFLGANATAADSSKLGGLPRRAYVIGGGVLATDVGNLGDDTASTISCCAIEPSPRINFELSCHTDGSTTLVVSGADNFSWWWDESFGDATLVASEYEATFPIGNGVERHSLRAVTSNGATTATLDLATSIGATCRFGWTLLKAGNQTPGN